MNLAKAELVRAFNALPRPLNLSDTQRAARHWYFNLWYWQIEPNPGHVLLVFQPETDVAHVIRLPLGISSNEPGYAYFPQTPEDAAPEIARALLQFFVNRRFSDIHGNDVRRPPKPRKFSTADEALARAVGDELTRLDIPSTALCTVDGAIETVTILAQSRFEVAYQKGIDRFLDSCGLPADDRPKMPVPPCHVEFTKAVPPDPEDEVKRSEEERFKFLVHQHTILVNSASPLDGTPTHGRKGCKQFSALAKSTLELLSDTSVQKMKMYADAGDPGMAFEYGMSLLLGLRCERDRIRAREYILKAAVKPDSQQLKAVAHGVLCEWYWETLEGYEECDKCIRYYYAAWHHATISARACVRVSPRGSLCSKTVLQALGPRSTGNMDSIETWIFYRALAHAFEAKEAHDGKWHEEWMKRRAANPNRYRCASPYCEIETDSGYLLRRCAGPCDKDKKPSYCTKGCQADDWENHKPFCREGAPNSVDKEDEFEEFLTQTPARQRGSGLLYIPLINDDDTVTLIASGTMDGNELLMLREDLSEEGGYHDEVYLIDYLPEGTRNIHEHYGVD